MFVGSVVGVMHVGVVWELLLRCNGDNVEVKIVDVLTTSCLPLVCIVAGRDMFGAGFSWALAWGASSMDLREPHMEPFTAVNQD